MWTPTTVIDIAHRRELPPYTYRGTLARAVQTYPTPAATRTERHSP